MKFPKNFVWGAATSSHQIEGNTINDWSVWEKSVSEKLAHNAATIFSTLSPVWKEVEYEAKNPQNYISGIADDSYKKFGDDLTLLKDLRVTAYRFSVEWSRVEPEEGKFDEAVLDHYKDQIIKLKESGIEPWVTILHRTIPVWIADQKGWANSQTPLLYKKYVEKLAERFGNLVTFWMPLNEPVLNVTGGYLAGLIPPNRKNPFAALKAFRNMASAHNLAYKVLHIANPSAHVGTAHAAALVQGYNNTWYNNLLARIGNYVANWRFLNAVNSYSDFHGIQYYTRGLIALRLNKYFLPTITEVKTKNPASDLGQEIYPEGLYLFTQMVWNRYKKPIYITENGIADRTDRYRKQFILDHIAQVERTIADGMNVRGYFHWSLIDNFEWDKGFWPKFGLANVDRTTLNRTLRPSAAIFKEIIEKNSST